MRNLLAHIVSGAALLALTALTPPALAAEPAVTLPPPTLEAAPATGLQTAVLAGGCFWGVQGVFQHTRGVVNVVSGYAGGSQLTAHYEQVSSGTTGHAESVEITYDPNEISYGRILQIFFSVAHDPTQLNRQGPDVGTQYRSAIFTVNDEQARIAAGYIAELDAAKVYKTPIVTKVGPLPGFFAAEDYHQDYMTLHPRQPYIVYNDLPKVENLKRLFAANYRATPALVRDAGNAARRAGTTGAATD
jgi:peptide-methionine (S)-S-oxide reductase